MEHLFAFVLLAIVAACIIAGIYYALNNTRAKRERRRLRADAAEYRRALEERQQQDRSRYP